MAARMPSLCPGCQHEMVVSQLTCPSCGTVVEGNFELNAFNRLSAEQYNFCLLFVRCRGSLKDVGAQMNISYPTARNKLDDLVRAMGFEQGPKTDMRMEILEQLSQGKITAEAALAKLKGADEG